MDKLELLYTPIGWPEVQDLMGHKGFRENAYLINDDNGYAKFGDSAYFVNVMWLNKIKLKNEGKIFI